MGQHPNGEKRITSRGTNSVASKTKQAERERGRYEKGSHRYQVARYYVRNLSEYSYRDAIPYLEQANEEGEFPRDHVPSYVSLSRWVKTYQTVQEEKDRSPCVFDFIADKRTGRDRKWIHPWVENWLYDQVLQGPYTTVPELHKAAVSTAEENDWEPPSEWQVRRYVDEFEVKYRSAAQHGRNAALIDAMPSSTIGADHPHLSGHERWPRYR